jgi:NAD(P)-dependent dehydrogenase (short-subunit alcohol dehydrogenase family)
MASPSTDPKSALDLTGKVAIITGSGKENGIGAGIALALARAGARVAVNYVSESTAARVPQVVAAIEAAAGEGSVVVVQADMSTPEGAEKLVEKTVEGFGVDHVDILGEARLPTLSNAEE